MCFTHISTDVLYIYDKCWSIRSHLIFMLIRTNVKTKPVHDMYCMKRDTQPPQTYPLINYKH